MITEYHLDAILSDKAIHDKVVSLKREFLDKTGKLLDLSDHDFFALIIISPSIDITLANGKISLTEEMSLNKKARKMSKGGYFMQTDPVVFAMKFLIEHYDEFKESFYDFIKDVINNFIDVEILKKVDNDYVEISRNDLVKATFTAPHILLLFIAEFFGGEIEQFGEQKKVSKEEYEVIVDAGKRLGIYDLHLYRGFCQTFNVK